MATEVSAETARSATEKEMEVAEILRDLSSTIESRQHVLIEDLQWGVKRRRSPPIYETISESKQADPAGLEEAAPTVEQDKKRDEPTGSGELLCFVKNGGDAHLGAPSLNEVKKKKSKKEIIKEIKKEVASLTKENEDLKKELAELKEKHEKLRAMNNNLKDETLDDLKTAAPKQIIKKSVKLAVKFKLNKSPLPSLEPIPVTDQNCRQEADLRAQPSEDMAECEVRTPLVRQFDKEEKFAKSTYARKRRLEIVREKKVHKRQAAKESSD